MKPSYHCQRPTLSLHQNHLHLPSLPSHSFSKQSRLPTHHHLLYPPSHHNEQTTHPLKKKKSLSSSTPRKQTSTIHSFTNQAIKQPFNQASKNPSPLIHLASLMLVCICYTVLYIHWLISIRSFIIHHLSHFTLSLSLIPSLPFPSVLRSRRGHKHVSYYISLT